MVGLTGAAFFGEDFFVGAFFCFTEAFFVGAFPLLSSSIRRLNSSAVPLAEKLRRPASAATCDILLTLCKRPLDTVFYYFGIFSLVGGVGLLERVRAVQLKCIARTPPTTSWQVRPPSSC